VAAVVLAAGASRRLGRPKALLPLGGRPVLERVVRAIVAAGVTEGVVVVGGTDEGAIRGAADPSPLAWVRNPDPDAGRLGSLRVGWEAVGPGRDVLLWPVDRPLAGEDVVREVLAARGDAGERFTVSPVSGGRGGHPVLLAAALREAILLAAPDRNLRTLLAATGARRIEVPTGDPGIHVNLDTEDDVRKLGR